MTGQKPNAPNYVNQDSHLELDIGEGRLLLGVFDGHGDGGTIVSTRVKSLFAEMAPAIASASDLRGAFQQAFAHAVSTVRREGIANTSGCTGTVAMVDSAQNRISIAYVGDSACLVIDPRGNISFQTTDHKPDGPGEIDRLRSRGSTVKNGRVVCASNPGDHLGLARSIGDFPYEAQGVIGEPDIHLNLMFEPGSSVVLASDGVWDMLPKDQLVRMIISASSTQEAAQQLVTTARSTWSSKLQQGLLQHIDDITAVLVRCLPV